MSAHPLDDAVIADPVLQEFVVCVQDMFQRENYFVPYVWAQRKVRNDNYHMQSQSLLENMFFDTFGDFLHRERPSKTLVRRPGREPWDYRFEGLSLSHKEATAPTFTAIWEGGAGPGFKTPRYPTWTFLHPVVLSYSPARARAILSGGVAGTSKRTRGFRYTALALTADVVEDVVKGANAQSSRVLLVSHVGAESTFVRSWTIDEWQSETYQTLRAMMPACDLATSTFWVIALNKKDRTTGFGPHDWPAGQSITIAKRSLFPGIYVFPTALLSNVSLRCNNRAHFPSRQFVREQMHAALRAGAFIPYHLWSACFAPTTPPNLYQELKQMFDAMFQARTT